MKTLPELINDLSDEFDKFQSKYASRVDALETKAARPHLTGNLAIPDLSDAQIAHSKAFKSFLRTGDTAGLADLQMKALSTAVGADGGYAVPEDLFAQIIDFMKVASPMRQVCRVETAKNDSFEMLLNLGGAASGWVGESDARPETGTPTIASTKPSMGEVYAAPAATQRLLDDAGDSITKWLIESVGRNFAADENAAFVSGNGTNKPKGLLTYTISAAPAAGELKQVKSGAAGSIAVDRLFEVVEALPTRHRTPNACWMMPKAVITQLRKLKDTTNAYLWTPGLEAGVPGTLLGYKVIENEDLPTPAASSNSVLFGDFSRGYLIADHRTGIRLTFDPYTARPKVVFYTTKRVGGGLLDSTALVVHTLGV